MRFSPRVAAAALALSIVFLSFAASALAGPKEEVAATTSAWGQALGDDDPDKVLPFYSDDAVLWGTLSPTVRADRAALRDYFVTAFKVLPGLKVTFGDQLIRVYGNTAVPDSAPAWSRPAARSPTGIFRKIWHLCTERKV